MICRKCGNEYPSVIQKCPFCESDQNNNDQINRSYDNHLSGLSDKRERRNGLFHSIIVLFVGLIVGFLFGVYAKPIDRIGAVRYPISNLPRDVKTVYVNISKGNVFHKRKSCRTETSILGIEKNSYSEISEYEAILRGFDRCPDCYEYATSSDVYGIEYSIQDIEDALKDY